jgi:hypothetical protein
LLLRQFPAVDIDYVANRFDNFLHSITALAIVDGRLDMDRCSGSLL